MCGGVVAQVACTVMAIQAIATVRALQYPFYRLQITTYFGSDQSHHHSHYFQKKVNLRQHQKEQLLQKA